MEGKDRREPPGTTKEDEEAMKDKDTILKAVTTLVLVGWYVLMPQAGYSSDSDILEHYTYILCHANIFHLCGNLLVLWLMNIRNLCASLMIAVLASFMPAAGSVWDGFAYDAVTMGFSGVLFAIAGINWGWAIYRTVNKGLRNFWYKQFALKVLPFAVLGVLIPQINWCLHTYCLLAGFVYGRCRR